MIADRDKLHQAVKPLALMERLLTIAPTNGLIVDPFVGSGSTCIAALRQGRRMIGGRDQPGFRRFGVMPLRVFRGGVGAQ